MTYSKENPVLRMPLCALPCPYILPFLPSHLTPEISNHVMIWLPHSIATRGSYTINIINDESSTGISSLRLFPRSDFLGVRQREDFDPVKSERRNPWHQRKRDCLGNVLLPRVCLGLGRRPSAGPGPLSILPIAN
jgi:hypothetical protein